MSARSMCFAILIFGPAMVAVAQPLPEPSRAPAEVMGDRPTTRPADVGPGSPAQPDSLRPARPLPEAATRADAPLEQGRTSFTEAQARGRMEQAGFGRISDLRLEESGIWRAAAERDGRAVRIGLDFRGTVRAD